MECFLSLFFLLHFDSFKYSPRPYTPALKLGDDVPEEVKAERLQAVFELVASQQSAHLAALVGTRQRVLFEGPSRGGEGRYSGRTERNEIVHADAPEPGVDLTGQIVDVDIERANRHSLMGVVAGPLETGPGRTSRAIHRPGPARRRLPVVGAPT